MGHPLSQTLFTCMFIERLLWPEPKTLEEAQYYHESKDRFNNLWLHQILRTYCIATIKTCHFVYSMVTSEHYYEVCSSTGLPQASRQF
jgi:N-alpha-acetyltransferase 35, NatC auxiliary subunit